jgi:hypothetical protein
LHFVLIEFLYNPARPPVRMILNEDLVCFLINLIILSIKPAYPQKKPDLTASSVFLPITFDIFLKLTSGIKDACEDKVLKDRLIPGAIMPPKYLFLIKHQRL